MVNWLKNPHKGYPLASPCDCVNTYVDILHFTIEDENVDNYLHEYKTYMTNEWDVLMLHIV